MSRNCLNSGGIIKMYRFYLLVTIVFTGLLVSCAAEQNDVKEINYESTKKIVVDILQTEDGKKAIQEAILDEEMKKELVIQSDIVKQSITDALHSEKGIDMWTRFFEEPDFAEAFIKSTADGQKELMKQLMHDATFQKQMIELLQNPELKKQTLSVMRGQQFREHLEKVIQESINSPLFLAKIEKTLLKAVEEEKKKDDESSGQSEKDKEETKDSENMGG